MNRDPAAALVLMLAAVVGALRVDRGSAGAKKIQVIKNLRAITGLSLAEADGSVRIAWAIASLDR